MAAPLLLERLIAGDPDTPFALIHRHGEQKVDVLTGTLTIPESLADIPLTSPEVLALVPFRQITERGFEAVDDGAPLLCLSVHESEAVPVADVLALIGEESPVVEGWGFEISDEEYADVAQEVIDREIGGGKGANFVIRRDYRAHTDAARPAATLSWFRNLLTTETGAYWTFAFYSPQMAAVGASPERHVSVDSGTVYMNPISGTLRHGDELPTEAELLAFLADRKESDELVMVVDEELKMMSAACPDGGVMRGPFLKPMSRLTHTEYLLEGRSSLDPREILRLTMFAPTVTGSPMRSSCSVIAEYEGTGRGYYSGVLARFTRTPTGYDLDAPILIRSAFLEGGGDIQVSAGATLVRHSNPMSEALETRAKTSGILGALGLGDASSQMASLTRPNPAVQTPEVLAALEDRNRNLAPFWRDEQTLVNQFTGTALVVDSGDEFAGMLAHQLRRMGLTVRVHLWTDVKDVSEPDLVVFGPGPGDPRDGADPRVRHLQALIEQRRAANKPLLATGFSHQVLAALAGLPLIELPSSRQGMAVEAEIMGEPALLGHYDTFTAVAEDGAVAPTWKLKVEAEPTAGFVHALVGDTAISVQGHLESVLSYDGFDVLGRMVQRLLGRSQPSADPQPDSE